MFQPTHVHPGRVLGLMASRQFATVPLHARIGRTKARVVACDQEARMCRGCTAYARGAMSEPLRQMHCPGTECGLCHHSASSPRSEGTWFAMSYILTWDPSRKTTCWTASCARAVAGPIHEHVEHSRLGAST